MKTEYRTYPIHPKSEARDKRIAREARRKLDIPLYKSGEPVKKNIIYEVIHGKIGILAENSETGKTGIVEVCKKGELLAVDELYSDVHRFTAKPVTVTAEVQPWNLELSDPATVEMVQKATEERIKKQDDVRQLLKTSYIPKKIAFALTDLVDEDQYVQLSTCEIGSRVGIGREQTCYAILSLQKRGIVEREKNTVRKILIKEPQQLEAIYKKKGA